MQNYKKMSHEEFIENINSICIDLANYIGINKLKIDYICPILRSGGVPAVYISNQLNIVKFAPMQVKHVTYKNGDNKIEILFNPFNSIEIKKDAQVFLIVEAMQSTGTSVEMCIQEIKSRYKDAKILYVCLAKEYGSKSFIDDVIYENTAFYYNGNNNFSEKKCKELKVENFYPLFPWENLEAEVEHPDDLEENIYF